MPTKPRGLFFLFISQYSQNVPTVKIPDPNILATNHPNRIQTLPQKRKIKRIPTSITLIPKPGIDKCKKGKTAINKDVYVTKTNSTKYEKTQNQTKLAEDKIILILSKVG